MTNKEKARQAEMKQEFDRLGIKLVLDANGRWRTLTQSEREVQFRKEYKARMAKLKAEAEAKHKARRMAEIPGILARLTERWPGVAFTLNGETIHASFDDMTVTVAVHAAFVGKPVDFITKMSIGNAKQIKSIGRMGGSIDAIAIGPDPISSIENDARMNVHRARHLLTDAIAAHRAILGVKYCPCTPSAAELAADATAEAEEAAAAIDDATT